MEHEKIRIATLRGCARCGEDHFAIEFEELIRPVMDDVEGSPFMVASYWAPCPTNGQPILLFSVSNTESV